MKQILFTVLASIFFISCAKTPKPIEFGFDNCDHCVMKISDERYGAELITQKGKIYKFDDVYCMKSFVEEGIVKQNQIYSLWFVDFENKNNLISEEQSYLLFNSELKSPMGSNIAVFSSIEARESQYAKHSGTLLLWKDYFNSK